MLNQTQKNRPPVFYSFLYQTGMSMGDFLFNSLLTGSFTGGLAGTGSKASIEAAKNLSLAIMGTSAASNATAEAIERGLSNRQAYALGAIAGFAEVLTEKFSLDVLLDEKWEDGAIEYILKNAFTEGTEEVGSDLINWAGDLLVSRDKSQWKQAIKGYEKRGYSPGEAFGLALRDQAQEMGMDLLGGILSGGLMSGGNVAINSSANVQMENLVSDATAEDLLRNESMVRFLNKHGELKLEKGMTQEQKRAAIRQAVENVVHKEKAASGEGDGEVHYSLKAFTDGRRFVDVDTDQAQFDGLTFEQLGYQARRAIKKKFIGKVIGIENRAFVNGNTAEEYGHPVKKLSQKEHEAKMRASAELDNLLEAGTNFRTDPDGRDGHIHPKSVGDFRYFDTIFKVGSEYYEGVINIEHIKKGFLLKDITNIRNITQEIRASYGENPQGRFLRDASMTSIPPNAKKGNKEVSTTDGDAQSQQQDAQPLTQADAKHFATETGTENGLVLDEYVQKHLRRETAERLNTLAKALGVRVRFVNSIRGGTANASIRGSDVQIERYNPNPVTFLLGHELTHRMQSLSPEAYARFKEAIRPEVEKEAQALHSLYRIRGEGIDFEGAIDEATANYAGRLLEKGPVLDQFIQRHRTDRSLLEKVLDAVRDILSKLTGQERKQAETAEAKLLAAMEETAEKVKKSGGEAAATDSSVERFSLADKHIPTYEELLQKQDINVVDIRGERTGGIADQRKNFHKSETAKKLYAAPVINRDTGERFFILPKSTTHSFYNLGLDQVGVAEHLGEIVEEAILTYKEESRKAPDDRSTGVYTLFGAVQTEEGIRPVKLKVKEYYIKGQSLPKEVSDYLKSGDPMETYASVYDGKVLVLESIEKEEASSNVQSTAETTTADKYPSASSITILSGDKGKVKVGTKTISVRKLLKMIKGDAEKYIPQPRE